ncbi:MAG: WGR domain-containing protein [Myxococcota bacterium]
MTRYELDDGPVRRFWEITREGSRITLNMGVVGSPGRARTKDHGTEARARTEEAKAIQAMTRLGYVEVRAPGPALPDALQRAMEDRTPDALRVLADWLIEQDDPWGPVLAESLASPGSVQPGHAGLDALDQRWFPGPDKNAVWRDGRPVAVTIACHQDRGYGAIARFFQTPAGHLVDRLEITGAFGEQGLRGLLEEGALPGLRELSVGDSRFDFPSVASALPALRHLETHDAYVVLGAPSLPTLEHLELHFEGPPSHDAVSHLGVARLPALRTLVIEVGVSEDRHGPALAGLLAHSPLIRRVELAHFRVRGMLARWLPSGPAELQYLQVFDGDLDDTDAEALLRWLQDHGDAEVHLDPNAISAPVLDALRGWPGVRLHPTVESPWYEDTGE